MLVVAVIHVDAYTFLLLQKQLGKNNQEASSLAAKSIGIDLVPYCAWNCGPITISSDTNIPKVLAGHLV